MKLLRAMVPALSAALRAPARLVGRGRALHATAARGAGSGGLFEDATALVGNTPVVKISDKLAPPGVEVYAKCEYFNPLASVKDRLAVAIIEDAEKRGELKPGMTVVEATSGNTGIAVAMVCAQRGYDCVICMAEPFSVERRRLMRMLGAKVIVTPKAGKGTGMVRKAEELCAKNGWFLCHQFGSVSKSTTELGLRRVDGVQGLIFFPTGSRTRRTGSSTRPRPAPKSSLISRRRARS